jgi:hypothetical protein
MASIPRQTAMKVLTTAASFVLGGLTCFADPPAPAAINIVERGPHYRVIQTVTPQPQADGTTSYTTNSYRKMVSRKTFSCRNNCSIRARSIRP